MTQRVFETKILIRGSENIGKIGKVFSLVAEMTLTVVGMKSRIRAKLLNERVKGIEPSYSAWKSPDFRNVFKSRSDISQLFGRLRSLRNFSLSEWRLLAKHSFFGSAVLGSVRVYPWSEVIPSRACWRPRCASRAYCRIVIAITVIA